MIRLACLALGYVFGLFQTAFFYGKIKGIDIRQHGSGNSGTTNTLRVLGTKAGLIVFAGDLLKAIIVIAITKLLICPSFPDIKQLLVLYTGAGCILGHNFPFYMNFKGGKGIATTGGIMIMAHWFYIPLGIVLFFGTFVLTHFVSLGSLILYVGFFTATVIMGQMGVFPELSQASLIEMYILVFLMGCLAFYMHRSNIDRLIHHNERKTYLFKKNKMDAETNANATKA